MDQPFEIILKRTLSPGPDGYTEQQDLALSFHTPMRSILQNIDPIALKILVALALSVHPLEGQEFQELLNLGIVKEQDRGRLAAVITSVELGRVVNADRRTVDRRCYDLAEMDWLSIHDLPPGKASGRFSGGRVYFLSAGKIVYTPQVDDQAPKPGLEHTRDHLQIGQRICPPPCTPDVHGDDPAAPTVYTGCTPHVHGMHRGCTPDVHGGDPKERGKVEIEERETTTAPAVVVDDPALPASSNSLHQHILAILDYFCNEVAQRWPAATDEKGRLHMRIVRDRYEGPRDLLLGTAPLASASQLPADLIEEVLILALAIQAQGPDDLATAIDRALASEEKTLPARRLAYVWPEAPGARNVKSLLRKNLQAGGQLPDGGGYREARKLFIALNRFAVGLPLLNQFLELCAAIGIRPVQAALTQALAEERSYITLAFLREAVRRQKAAGGKEPPASAADPPDLPAGGADREEDAAVDPPSLPAGGTGTDREEDAVESGAGPPARADGLAAAIPSPGDAPPGVGPPDPPEESGVDSPGNGRRTESDLVRDWLRDYGIVGPPLELAKQARLATVRAWMLYLDHQERLDDTARRGILVNRLRAGDEPPPQYRRWARLLPPLDPVEEFMLESEYQKRRWDDEWWWPEDVLEVIGEEPAEQWLQAQEDRPARR